MEKSLKKIEVIDNAIDIEALEKITSIARYGYGWNSSKVLPISQQGHWNVLLTGRQLYARDERKISLQANDPLVEKLDPLIVPFWHKTKELFGARRLCRGYLNGYTYGTDAYLHVDTDYTEYPQDHDCILETVMFYLNSTWNPDYAGETVFVEDDDIIKSVLPKPGRVVCFSSDILHGARPLSRACYLLRQVLVFKTVVDKYSEEDAISFLQQHASEIPHSDTSLFVHLTNTFEMMKAMEFPRQACLAGLFHSIYDTEFFKAGLNFSREQIRDVIGKKAEEIVYQFCTLRPRKQHILSPETINQYELAAVEYANLLEQSQRFDIMDFDYVNQLKAIIKRD